MANSAYGQEELAKTDAADPTGKRRELLMASWEEMEQTDAVMYQTNMATYLALSLIHILHNVLLAESGSVMKICLLLLLLLSTFVANFTLYRIVLDSIKIQHLEKTAASDPLTGLGNRTGLLDHLEALLAGAEPLDVYKRQAFLHCNDFRKFNIKRDAVCFRRCVIIH